MVHRYTTPLLAALAFCGASHAQDMAQVRKGYADMCRQAVALPAEYGGESDLKGNPKLAPYCDCLAVPWADRAIKAINGAAPLPPDQIAKQELALRTDCRKKAGAPPPPPIKPVG